MPSASPFLSHGRILRTANGNAEAIAGIANVATDAFADVVEPTLFDLLRQERVGDGGTGRTDEVEIAAFYPRHHGVRRRKTADPHDRLGGQ